jgi:hypothetical protein
MSATITSTEYRLIIPNCSTCWPITLIRYEWPRNWRVFIIIDLIDMTTKNATDSEFPNSSWKQSSITLVQRKSCSSWTSFQKKFQFQLAEECDHGLQIAKDGPVNSEVRNNWCHVLNKTPTSTSSWSYWKEILRRPSVRVELYMLTKCKNNTVGSFYFVFGSSVSYCDHATSVVR